MRRRGNRKRTGTAESTYRRSFKRSTIFCRWDQLYFTFADEDWRINCSYDFNRRIRNFYDYLLGQIRYFAATSFDFLYSKSAIYGLCDSTLSFSLYCYCLYLARFIKDLASLSSPIRLITFKDAKMGGGPNNSKHLNLWRLAWWGVLMWWNTRTHSLRPS